MAVDIEATKSAINWIFLHFIQKCWANVFFINVNKMIVHVQMYMQMTDNDDDSTVKVGHLGITWQEIPDTNPWHIQRERNKENALHAALSADVGCLRSHSAEMSFINKFYIWII